VKRNEDAYGSFLSDAEIAYVSGIQGVYCFRKTFAGSSKAIDAGFSAYESSAHPNQKPVDLMQWCLSFTRDDSPICDPYMGSGTTLVAAKNLGRKAIGIELEERYCEIAANRLRQSVLNFEGEVA
jgi:DNA modification methylase